MDIENVTNTIVYIQEIKARLADLENEKELLTKELEELRKEVMGVL